MEEQGDGALGAVMLRAAYQEVVLDSCDPLLEMSVPSQSCSTFLLWKFLKLSEQAQNVQRTYIC